MSLTPFSKGGSREVGGNLSADQSDPRRQPGNISQPKRPHVGRRATGQAAVARNGGEFLHGGALHELRGMVGRARQRSPSSPGGCGSISTLTGGGPAAKRRATGVVPARRLEAPRAVASDACGARRAAPRAGSTEGRGRSCVSCPAPPPLAPGRVLSPGRAALRIPPLPRQPSFRSTRARSLQRLLCAVLCPRPSEMRVRLVARRSARERRPGVPSGETQDLRPARRSSCGHSWPGRVGGEAAARSAVAGSRPSQEQSRSRRGRAAAAFTGPGSVVAGSSPGREAPRS